MQFVLPLLFNGAHTRTVSRPDPNLSSRVPPLLRFLCSAHKHKRKHNSFWGEWALAISDWAIKYERRAEPAGAQEMA